MIGSMSDPILEQTSPTYRQAAASAESLGCSGAHRVDGGWLPCQSSEALLLLIRRGVVAYREEYEKKGLLGTAVRKLRYVSVNPKARDADGDGLIQEGTTAERSVKKAGKQTTRVKLNSAVKKDSRPPKADVARIETHFATLLDKVNGEIVKLGGLGRARTSKEGPTPEISRRLDEVSAVVESTYGPTNTLEEMQNALRKGFPNANVDFTVHRKEPKNIRGSATVSTALEAQNPLEAFGGEDARIGLQAFTRAILYKANDDPEAATLIGEITLTEPSSVVNASAGVSIGLKSNAPISIAYSPSSGAKYKEIGDAQTALALSAQIRDDLELRDEIKQTGAGFWSAGGLAHTNADIAANNMWTGFHEWAHVKGLALAYQDRDEQLVASLQEWVSSGVEAPWMEKYPELLMADNRVKRAVAAVAKGGGFEGVVSGYMERLGFKDVDYSNQEQLRAIYRAIAVRHVLANELMRGLEERTAKMKLNDWKKFDAIGGYSNIDIEEGIAEVLAYADSVPDEAWEKFKEAYKLAEISERI